MNRFITVFALTVNAILWAVNLGIHKDEKYAECNLFMLLLSIAGILGACA